LNGVFGKNQSPYPSHIPIMPEMVTNQIANMELLLFTTENDGSLFIKLK
jgi:hypothetical protein